MHHTQSVNVTSLPITHTSNRPDSLRTESPAVTCQEVISMPFYGQGNLVTERSNNWPGITGPRLEGLEGYSAPPRALPPCFPCRWKEGVSLSLLPSWSTSALVLPLQRPPPPLPFREERPLHLFIFTFNQMQLLFRKDQGAV